MLNFFLFCLGLLFTVGNTDIPTYKEDYFDQYIDHFDFTTHGDKTFKQRYLYNDQWWNPRKGPIFFYAGNEDDITDFWNNTGFIFEIAPQFHALVLFAEHRYYGESLPFGHDSFKLPFIGLLSIQHAIADYAFLITGVKKKFNAENCPVIVFGGSYGGVLAAYMRFKYPNIVKGAIAASAPIYHIAGKVPGDAIFQVTTKDFRNVSTHCEDQVRADFAQLQEWAALGPTGYQKITQSFNLCNPISSPTDYDHLLRWIRTAFVAAAMMDYPYYSTFVESFPAFPVNVMCNFLMTSETPVQGMYYAVSLVYNATHNLPCNNIYEQFVFCGSSTGCDSTTSPAWDYQICTEINLEGDSNGVTDMFPFLPYTAAMRDDYCMKKWNVRPRRNWLDVLFWGNDINSTSNIVFSNGDLDPYSAGGVKHDISTTIHAVTIKEGAHHLDLRGSNPADPQSVIDARKLEIKCIREWLEN